MSFLQYHGSLHALRADGFVFSHCISAVDAESVSSRRRPLIDLRQLVHRIRLPLIHWRGRSMIDRLLARSITVLRIDWWRVRWRPVAQWTNPFVVFWYPSLDSTTFPTFLRLPVWPVQVYYPT